MFLGFKPSFWLTLQIIRHSPFVGVESCPSFSWTPGVRFPFGPPSPGKARKLIDYGLHSIVSMAVMHAEDRGPRHLIVSDGERFTGTAAQLVGECLGLDPGPVSDRLCREFRDWLRSEGGVFRTPGRRRYREIVVNDAGVITVVPGEPVSYDIM